MSTTVHPFRAAASRTSYAASAPTQPGPQDCVPTRTSFIRPSRNHRSAKSLSRTIDPPQPSTLIFSDDGFCCRRRAGCRRRDGEGDPGIPATGTILCGKLSVSLEIEIALHVADRKKESDLGTDANHLGLEAADTVA